MAARATSAAGNVAVSASASSARWRHTIAFARGHDIPVAPRELPHEQQVHILHPYANTAGSLDLGFVPGRSTL